MLTRSIALLTGLKVIVDSAPFTADDDLGDHRIPDMLKMILRIIRLPDMLMMVLRII